MGDHYRTISLISSIILLTLLSQAYGWTCSKEIFGNTISFECPQAGDSSDKIYCCGTKKARFCCNSDDFAKTINAIGWIVGVLVSTVVVVIIVVFLSCFCCSCCLLAKRRQTRGRVLYAGPVTAATTTTTPYPAQPAPYPPAGSYPQQPAGYPAMGYPPQPYHPAMGYPPTNPPPYPEQQPAYNPSYQS